MIPPDVCGSSDTHAHKHTPSLQTPQFSRWYCITLPGHLKQRQTRKDTRKHIQFQKKVGQNSCQDNTGEEDTVSMVTKAKTALSSCSMNAFYLRVCVCPCARESQSSVIIKSCPVLVWVFTPHQNTAEQGDMSQQELGRLDLFHYHFESHKSKMVAVSNK